MASSSGKRCLYEILGLNRDCSPEEIRSSYRKLALQRHPDKLITQAGISDKEANAAFQELVNAYEVLSDPKERSWYDSHRNKILFSEPKTSSGPSYSHSSVPDLFSYYSNSCYSGFGHTGKGFYKVYGDLFDKIYAQEVATAKKLGLGVDCVGEAPLMGNLECDYSQVAAFYNYWSGFSSVMEFWWADEHDVELGYDRKSRRLCEEQNKKCRKKAKKEYNETVRGLVEFVKKRDKRIVEMKMKKALEVEKKKEELKEKKKELERQKLERARLYEEPDWAKVEEEDIGLGFEEVDNNNNKKKKDEINELYCVICSKKFKSDKQWKNHEQSKKHKEKVAMFRDEIGSDDQSEEEEEILNEVNGDMGPSVSGNDAVVDDLSEKFEDAFEFQEEESEEVKKPSIKEEDEVEEEEEEEEEEEIDNDAGNSGSDEESILLKAMLSRQKNKKKAASKRETEMTSSSKAPDTTTTDDGVPEFLVYDNMKKSARGNRRAKRDNGKQSNGVSQRSEMNEVTEEASSDSNMKHIGIEEGNEPDNAKTLGSSSDTITEEVSSDSNIKHIGIGEGNEPDNSKTLGSSSDTIDKVGQKSRADPPPLGKNVKGHKKTVDKRGSGIEDMASKKTSKGRKQKGASKSTDHSCDTCGQDFESRNKLHRHLGDTGHASLKSR